MIHLRSVGLRSLTPQQQQAYPFNLPILAQFRELELTKPVTFLVGENGCGKSTLLEAIAYSAQAITVGSAGIDDDDTLADVRPLAKRLKLTWSARTQQGFFLRAEDFFGFIKRVADIRRELEEDIRRVKREYADRSKQAQGLALMPFMRELADLKEHYGDGLETMSHGEGFLRLFQSRFVPNGLYLLDEPETPLSPVRQLALIAQIKLMVAENCQFIIATHSPILMAFPDAEILQFTDGGVESAEYNTLEHVTLTRDFLNNPETFLRYL